MSWHIYINTPEDNIAEVSAAVRPSGQMRINENREVIQTTEAELYVTYNYSRFYQKIWGEKSLNALDGLTVAAALPLLKAAVTYFGTERDEDYWKGTEGNAGFALWLIKEMCEELPESCVIEVSG